MLGHTVKSMYMLVIPGVTKVYYPWYDPCLMTSAVKPAPLSTHLVLKCQNGDSQKCSKPCSQYFMCGFTVTHMEYTEQECIG